MRLTATTSATFAILKQLHARSTPFRLCPEPTCPCLGWDSDIGSRQASAIVLGLQKSRQSRVHYVRRGNDRDRRRPHRRSTFGPRHVGKVARHMDRNSEGRSTTASVCRAVWRTSKCGQASRSQPNLDSQGVLGRILTISNLIKYSS